MGRNISACNAAVVLLTLCLFEMISYEFWEPLQPIRGIGLEIPHRVRGMVRLRALGSRLNSVNLGSFDLETRVE